MRRPVDINTTAGRVQGYCDPRFEAVGDTSPFPVSDHRLVWVDVAVPI